MLAHEGVARYLLDRGLLSPAHVLDGDLTITDISNRNRNFRVVTRDGPAYVLKQDLEGGAAGGVAHEAAVYMYFTQRVMGLANYLPVMHEYDPDEGVLVIDLVRDGEDLRALHLRTGAFPPVFAARLGSALGALHSVKHAKEVIPGARSARPSILRAHRPGPDVFRDVSAGGLELIRVLQTAPGFAAALDRVGARWRADTFIHGDAKWDNCVGTVTDDGEQEVRLIDWESAGAGDKCWDIGSVLGDYLSFWLFSMQILGSEPPERLPACAEYPLDAMRPALHACWAGYISARGLSGATAATERVRAMEFAGVRLVQAANMAAQMTHELTSSLILHLQLAVNILNRPHLAATQLVSLPP